MSQHFKSLLSQLQPFLNKTPSPGFGIGLTKRKSKLVEESKETTMTGANLFCLSAHKFSSKKIKINLEAKKRSSRKLEFKLVGSSCSPSSSSELSNNSSLTDSLNSLKTSEKKRQIKERDAMRDSGVESASTPSTSINNNYEPNIKKVKSCECVKCLTRLNRRSQIEKNLKLAFINYLKTSSESSFANIPMLVVRSFKPSLHQLKSEQLSQIEAKKGSAVNALFMKDNIWVYVKTISGQCGFVPKKCCEPFVLKNCSIKAEKAKKNSDFENLKSKQNKILKLPLPAQPKQTSQMEHTYMTINDNDILANVKKSMKLANNYMNDASLDDEEMSNGNQTNIALLSVSNFAQVEADNKEYEKTRLKSKCRRLIRSTRRFYELSQNYENLFEFSQQIKRTNKMSPILEKNNLNEAVYDDLGNCESAAQLTPFSSSSNNYDALMTLKSYNRPRSNENVYLNVDCANEENENVYDHLCTANNTKILNMFKVIDDYEADFQGDLSVRKGDLVYLVDERESKEKNNEWLLVKFYRRNLNDENKFETQKYEGYIPASHAARI